MKTDAAEKRAFAADIANGFIAVLSERKRKGETRPSISFSCVLYIFYSPQFTTKRSGNVIYILTYLTIPRISHIPLILLCLFLFLMFFFFFNNRFKFSLFTPSILYYFSSFRCLPFLFSAYNFLNISLLFFSARHSISFLSSPALKRALVRVRIQARVERSLLRFEAAIFSLSLRASGFTHF